MRTAAINLTRAEHMARPNSPPESAGRLGPVWTQGYGWAISAPGRPAVDRDRGAVDKTRPVAREKGDDITELRRLADPV